MIAIDKYRTFLFVSFVPDLDCFSVAGDTVARGFRPVGKIYARLFVFLVGNTPFEYSKDGALFYLHLRIWKLERKEGCPHRVF